MKKKGIKPRLRLGLDRPLQGERFHQVFAIRRYWPAIVILLVFDVIFLVPAIVTAHEAIELWSAPGNLFRLVAALFTTFWLLGWSMAPLAMTMLLLVLLFGREVVRVRAGMVQVSLGLPLLVLQVQYATSVMRNLRLEYPPDNSGKSWRGPHAAFDYGARGGEFGSSLSEQEFERVKAGIEAAAGGRFRRGEALPAELEGDRTGELPDRTAALDGSASSVATARTVQRGDAHPVALNSPTVLALVGANLVVLAGAVSFGWDLGMVMVLYWAESAIIGFFNICKIGVIGGWAGMFAGLFFAGHFGGFMAVHFLFLHALFIQGPSGDSASADLAEVALLFTSLWPALVILFLSHAYSFMHNFLGRKEYEGRTIRHQMHEPYGRIVFMHLVLIIGGGLTLMLGEVTPVLMGIIVLKIFIDVRSHRRQRETGPGGDVPVPGTDE